MTTYITPVTDRSETDILNETAKGFFNVSDFARLNNNQLATYNVMNVLHPELSDGVEPEENPFLNVINPVITNMPDLNNYSPFQFPYLIEGLRITFGVSETLIPPVSTSDYSFNYIDLNTWEYTLDLIMKYVETVMDYQVYCGVAAVGQARFYQNRFRAFPGVPEVASPVRRGRCGIAGAGIGITRNNRFRRYA